MLWEYIDLTVLPFFETWSAHIFGGWQRVCWCTNEAFNQASSTKEFLENWPKRKGEHICGKNEGGGHNCGNDCTAVYGHLSDFAMFIVHVIQVLASFKVIAIISSVCHPGYII